MQVLVHKRFHWAHSIHPSGEPPAKSHDVAAGSDIWQSQPFRLTRLAAQENRTGSFFLSGKSSKFCEFHLRIPASRVSGTTSPLASCTRTCKWNPPNDVKVCVCVEVSRSRIIPPSGKYEIATEIAQWREIYGDSHTYTCEMAPLIRRLAPVFGKLFFAVSL